MKKYKNITLCFLLIANVFFLPVASALDSIEELFNGTWEGVEVMGCDYQTSNYVRTLIPLEKGSQFLPDRKKLKSWCDIAKEKTGKEIKCSVIGYVEGKYYFGIEIIPGSMERFRSIPQNSKQIAFLPEILNDLYQRWERGFSEHMQKDTVPKQFYQDGYLQCSDPTLQLVSAKLAQNTPNYNQVLLDILRYSNNPDERTKAATLLSWSKHPSNVDIIINENLINDADDNVRNELVRTISYVINDVTDEKVIEKSILALCRQAALPSHSDRTKALAAILTIVHNNKNHASFINGECEREINYISQMSILPNVAGTAKEILRHMKSENSYPNQS